MKKQPEGVRRVARGERKTDENGKRLPPDEYDIYLGEAHLGWSQRLPRGLWRMHPVTGNVAPEFSDHTAGVEHLLSVHHGLEYPSDAGSAEETEAIQADPEAMAAIAEAQAEIADEPVLDTAAEPVVHGDDMSVCPGPCASHEPYMPHPEGPLPMTGEAVATVPDEPVPMTSLVLDEPVFRPAPAFPWDDTTPVIQPVSPVVITPAVVRDPFADPEDQS